MVLIESSCAIPRLARLEGSLNEPSSEMLVRTQIDWAIYPNSSSFKTNLRQGDIEDETVITSVIHAMEGSAGELRWKE